MLNYVRQQVINSLWNSYRSTSNQMKRIEKGLRQKGIYKFSLDHFAVIDLPGPHTGISQMQQIFSALGYSAQGSDYLPERQNDFLWLAATDSVHTLASEALPQVVVADFRLEELPLEIRCIIEKYAQQASIAPMIEINKLTQQISMGSEKAAKILRDYITYYFAGRDWPLPTVKEFQTIQEFNELLAWVCVFGRQPNHFTLAVHLLPAFTALADFAEFISAEIKLVLNTDGGLIKGGEHTGIAQSATMGDSQTVMLADGPVQISTGFVEFAWRYPTAESPQLWSDFFTGFVAQNADRVIQSLTSSA